MKEIDDITLMAYADGELPEDEALLVAEAIKGSPELQAKIDKHLKLQKVLDTAFDEMAGEPLPEPIEEIKSELNAPSKTATILPFSNISWGMPTAIAAAIALVVFLTVSPDQKPYTGLVPQQVTDILDQTLSNQMDGATTPEITVLGSYQGEDGSFCRTFTFAAPDTEVTTRGLACQQDRQWSIIATAPYVPDNAFLPASGEKDAVAKVLETMTELAPGAETTLLKP